MIEEYIRFCIPSPDDTCKALKSIHVGLPQSAYIDTIPYFSNRRGLPELYNDCINQAIEDNVDWLVLCHNDITVESADVVQKILTSGFDVVGVAGTKHVELKEPALWHIMAGGWNSGNMSGAVAHTMGEQKHMTAFGPYPSRVVMIDGVFMAIKRNVFESVRFDESNPAKFHFYDLDYSLSAHNAGYRVGVGDILITHDSPGLRSMDDVQWQAGQKWFLGKHA